MHRHDRETEQHLRLARPSTLCPRPSFFFSSCPPFPFSSPLLSSKPNFANLDDYASLLHHSRLLLLAHTERERGGTNKINKQSVKLPVGFPPPSLVSSLRPTQGEEDETRSSKERGGGGNKSKRKTKQDDNAAKEENQPTTRDQKNPKKQSQTHTHKLRRYRQKPEQIVHLRAQAKASKQRRRRRRYIYLRWERCA